MLINSAVYDDGRIVAEPGLHGVAEALQRQSGFVWIALKDPSDEELQLLQAELSLPPLAVEDARKGHQRPKLEEYGDMLFVVPTAISATNWCSAYQVTQLAGTNQAVHGITSPWNSGAQVAPAAGYVAGDRIVNAGQVILRTFAVDANYSLQQRTLNLASGAMDTLDLFPQIVMLRAMYGKDTDGDNTVDTFDNTTPTTNAGWRQVRAVRLALVARSSSYQKDEVTTTAPLWDVGTVATIAGTTTCGSSKCLALPVNGVPDWQHYRYAVFEVTAPLRNVIWGQ